MEHSDVTTDLLEKKNLLLYPLPFFSLQDNYFCEFIWGNILPTCHLYSIKSFPSDWRGYFLLGVVWDQLGTFSKHLG